ncbi:non-ribosomal peptide synthetase [Longimicrobium terrae]|uniref:Amino acid adenylation domain-containing protein n=1 Tax=Longimicrobium terrae TaxID=1639882 RepID=A0A841GSQ0_9BACT|nr:non-ribosomal peptide synthetase [Longimicrobium terrae]MBB4635035.1 amino acid adenylation domain-containing protein [Longimicrobium terrae]MBB6069429.1 amino acid adenylation domain-containing protein [Longimicrobium terrae]NNC31766.1 amino acid adenylation domain-containing protein [Longimicrobium terrae]
MDSTNAPTRSDATASPAERDGSGRKKLDLLLRLAGRLGGGGADVIRPRAAAGPAPLSFGQERMWLLHQLDPASAAYNITGAYRLASVNAPVLERALGEVVRRHEALRTTFHEVDGTVLQHAAPFAGFILPVEDLSGHMPAAREAEMIRRAGQEAVRPYDLSAGPLFRPRLLRLGDGDVLLLNLHHAVADGWSIGVLLREVSTLYAAFLEGAASPLAPPQVQYADYAAWQRERLRGDTLERHLAYWRERLAGAPALLDLPADRPRPAVQSFRGDRVALDLPADLRDRVNSLAREEDASLFMVLLAAFQMLVARYGAGDDIVVGSPMSGRGRREVEEVIGFFVNTVVLRTRLDGDPSFREVVRRVRETTLGAFEHQEVPFERLVAELQPERSLAHSPLFHVMFTTEAVPDAEGSAHRLDADSLEVQTDTAQFDLTLGISESRRGLHAWLTYSTDLFERQTADRMLTHFARVLRQGVDDPDLHLSRLRLQAGAERALVVEEWNRTERPYPRGVCIHELFAARAAAQPDAVALAWDGETVTYAELDARANRLAHHLAGLGVGPERRVGVLLDRSIHLIVSVLAILKAGGCYVPIDPEYPAERLELMLADSGIRVLLARGTPVRALPGSDLRTVPLDEADVILALYPASAPRSGVSPENLAYINYTSGSTGRPKGVMVGHREVIQLVVNSDHAPLLPGDRVAHASNPSFDAMTFEVWGALLNGATLVGVSRDVLLSGARFRRLLEEQRVTTLYLTTALLNHLSREQPGIFGGLRELLHGGQQVDADSIRYLLGTGRPGRLLHVYGPTEITAWCTCQEVRDVPAGATTVPIGGPIGNARMYVLDGALEPLPVAVPGEAYVGGDGVVRGYLDRPALTAERFVPDPFASQPGARMYRTGDRMRWRAEGTLEFVGRLDDQVKIRGFRIEPGEVESVLAAHPDVREARVIVREDQPGEKRLVAYVVGDADADTLRADLRRGLPEYMVPAAFVAVASLPLTPSGKLDVRALPAPEMVQEDRYAAPRTPVEEVLAGIWSALLGVERVGIRDNFFEMGGHSLLATRVISRVRAVLGADLPLRALFEKPTIAGLAGVVEKARREGAPALPPVVPVMRRPPLSFAQERLWFLDQMQPGSTTYNMHSALRLSGPLNAPALERALGEVVRRHEALRTVFREEDGAPVQVILPVTGFRLAMEDLSHLDETERGDEVRRRVDAEAARPFDLSAGPLFRAALLVLGEQEQVLWMGMHHAVSDGWSLGVLHRELAALYAAYADGRESPLDEPAVQYADYAVWQRQQLAGEYLERSLGWWRGRLSGAPALLELPTDRPRPAVQTFGGATLPVTVPANVLKPLRDLGHAEGATLFMVLLGAFQALLSRYGGGDDVVVGTPVSGRARGEVEELIGFFVNTLALRTDLSGDPSFREVLRRVRETTLGAFDHQEVPFEKLVAELQPERSLSHSPLFQVMFTLDAGSSASPGLSGVAVEEMGTEGGAAKFDLTLGLGAVDDGLAGALTWRTDLWDRATVERMMEHLGRVLEQVAANPAVRLSELELLGAGERRVVLEEWNRTAFRHADTRPVHERFAEWAARTPDAPAVVHGDRTLTYAELERRAGSVARRLRARVVGPDVPVGVCLERGPELVAALLGVLRAGGAYVALDPAYPAERLDAMVADSGARVLLTRRALAAALPARPGVEVADVDGWMEDDGSASTEAAEPAESTGPRSLAYVIYTSGSTGTPKAVGVEHAGLANLCAWHEAAFAVTAEDRATQLASPGFDASAWEVWPYLTRGACVEVVPDAVRADPAALRDWLVRRRVTIAFVPTPLAEPLLALPWPAETALRWLLAGGDRLATRPAAHLPFALSNNYGPTETTVVATSGQVTPEGARAPSIGRPLHNTRCYVLSPSLRPLPAGVPGELYVGGAQVARGYLGRPAMTAERFVPDPFSRDAGARMYRTGDRVRWRADGALESLGRLDAQAKIRGFRIEPGEVEAALRRHPAVRDCAVVVREDAPGDRRLAAYVVGGADPAALRAHLRRTLPDYMVPAAIVALDALPMTPGGKLDRRALPAPAAAAPAEGAVVPAGGMEARMAAVWREVLGVAAVGMEDNFFDLGGHSLLLVKLQARVAAEFGVQVPVVELFQFPTARALAGRLAHGADAGAVEEGGERGGARQAGVSRLEARRAAGRARRP